MMMMMMEDNRSSMVMLVGRYVAVKRQALHSWLFVCLWTLLLHYQAMLASLLCKSPPFLMFHPTLRSAVVGASWTVLKPIDLIYSGLLDAPMTRPTEDEDPTNLVKDGNDDQRNKITHSRMH